MQALIDGDKTRAQELRDQLDYEREIARLKALGFTDDEAAAEAKKTRELRDQLALKEAALKADEQAARLRKIEDDDAVDKAKARGESACDRSRERQRAEDERRDRLKDAGLSGQALTDKLAEEMGTYDRLHRRPGVIDARAPQAKVQSGLTMIDICSRPPSIPKITFATPTRAEC